MLCLYYVIFYYITCYIILNYIYGVHYTILCSCCFDVQVANWLSFAYIDRVVPIQPVRQSLNQMKATNVEKNLATNIPLSQPATPAAIVVQPLTNTHVPINTVKPGM